MSRWRSENHTLRVQQDRLDLFHHTNGAAELLSSHTAFIAGNGAADPASLEAILDDIRSRSRLKITVDDGLARFWQASAPQNASRRSDLEAAAWMRFESLFGESEHTLQLAADWSLDRPFLACALPTGLVGSLAQCLNAPRYRHIRIDGCVPAFVRVWNDCEGRLPDGESCLVVENNATLTIALCEQGHIVALKSIARDADLPVALEHADREIANLALQNGVVAPTTVLLSLMDAGASFAETHTRNLVWNTVTGSSTELRAASMS